MTVLLSRRDRDTCLKAVRREKPGIVIAAHLRTVAAPFADVQHGIEGTSERGGRKQAIRGRHEVMGHLGGQATATRTTAVVALAAGVSEVGRAVHVVGDVHARTGLIVDIQLEVPTGRAVSLDDDHQLLSRRHVHDHFALKANSRVVVTAKFRSRTRAIAHIQDRVEGASKRIEGQHPIGRRGEHEALLCAPRKGAGPAGVVPTSADIAGVGTANKRGDVRSRPALGQCRGGHTHPEE